MSDALMVVDAEGIQRRMPSRGIQLPPPSDRWATPSEERSGQMAARRPPGSSAASPGSSAAAPGSSAAAPSESLGQMAARLRQSIADSADDADGMHAAQVQSRPPATIYATVGCRSTMRAGSDHRLIQRQAQDKAPAASSQAPAASSQAPAASAGATEQAERTWTRSALDGAKDMADAIRKMKDDAISQRASHRDPSQQDQGAGAISSASPAAASRAAATAALPVSPPASSATAAPAGSSGSLPASPGSPVPRSSSKGRPGKETGAGSSTQPPGSSGESQGGSARFPVSLNVDSANWRAAFRSHVKERSRERSRARAARDAIST